MNIHSIITNSAVNGPGNRFVIWTQGCSLRCSGCWNSDTHPMSGGTLYSRNELFGMIISQEDIEGITISGGEPFEQANELYELTKLVGRDTDLTQIVYTGFKIGEIRSEKNMIKVLDNIDVLIDGRFIHTKISSKDLIGSSNQKHHFLTKRYNFNDFRNENRVEYHFIKDGSIKLTGFPKGV